jgi:hypothetical protein
LIRVARFAIILAAALRLAGGPSAAAGIDDAVEGTRWGETTAELVRELGARATVLPQPIDFGDSYVDIVLRQVPVGGYPLIAYYQMDKTTHRLKRIQLERPRHAVNPPVFRAVLAALEAAYGDADAMCGVRPAPSSGFQAAAEYIWTRGGTVIRAIFRDTTLQAFEGCFFGSPCGLTAQLLVRASPPQDDPATCRPAKPPPHG